MVKASHFHDKSVTFRKHPSFLEFSPTNLSAISRSDSRESLLRLSSLCCDVVDGDIRSRERDVLNEKVLHYF